MASSLRHKSEKSASIDRFYKAADGPSKTKIKAHHPHSWSPYRAARPKIVRTYKMTPKPKLHHPKS